MARPAAKIDPELVERAQRGEASAHAALYEAFAPMVYTLARRMLVSGALAEDVLQETFVEVIRHIGQYRGSGTIGSWIKRVAVNRCLAYLRSPWRSRRIDAAEWEPAAAPSCDDQIALERALAELSPTARAVVWLHDVEGFTHPEIAALMRRSESFSKSQLARARERLRAALRPEAERGRDHAGGEPVPCKPVLKTC